MEVEESFVKLKPNRLLNLICQVWLDLFDTILCHSRHVWALDAVRLHDEITNCEG